MDISFCMKCALLIVLYGILFICFIYVRQEKLIPWTKIGHSPDFTEQNVNPHDNFWRQKFQDENLANISGSVDIKQKKVIVSWTKYFNRVIDAKFMAECPQLLDICQLTPNRSLYSSADAIVFYPDSDIDYSMLPNRSSHQRFVLLMMEAPATQSWYYNKQLNGIFNWTMTYRFDSDIPRPYSHLGPDPKNRFTLNTTSILNKTKAVIWFVSNCGTPSQREKYVNELEKYLQIDIYGGCGQFRNCGSITDANESLFSHRPSPCEQQLIDKEYKFYIAFENSICLDYVTEKFYNRWNFNSVPIVLSRRIVQNILPPNSFIAADDFPNGPRQLAEYLKFLMSNETEYLKYFQWKIDGYSMTKRHPVTGLQWGFCGLCEKLWRQNESEYKVYEDVQKWWAGDGICDKGELVNRLLLNQKS